MMGYRDPNDDTWEAEFWDDYLRDFGREAYISVRYEGNHNCFLEDEDLADCGQATTLLG